MPILPLLLLFQAVSGRPTIPYSDFSKAGAGFYGSGRELPEPEGLESVKIGVLGPEKTAEGFQLRLAVEIALDEANALGGYVRKPNSSSSSAVSTREGVRRDADHAIPFEMIFHPDDGPWGAAARQVVQFAYEDKVWAIVGALDGQHTHIAELIVAKAWLPIITPGATDSSIEYANVPWVFRVVPSDARQAGALIAYAKAKGYKHLAVVSEIERESYAGYKRLKLASWHQQFPIELHLEYSPLQPEEIIPRLKGCPMDALLLWGNADSALRLLRALRAAAITVPVLGPSTLAGLDQASETKSMGEVVIAHPLDPDRIQAANAEFYRKFAARCGQPPSVVAFYAYDVARMVVQAVRTAGLNRARIRDALSNISFDGLTGHIQFNPLGGNPAEPVLLHMDNEGWRPLTQKAQ